MHNVFIAALLYAATTSVEPIAAFEYDTEAECIASVEYATQTFQENEIEMTELILATGADDMLVGCFTADEAATILGD